jgi:hypothetical protein
MKITPRSSLKHVAVVVASALNGANIRAVLTGGACATIYSAGAYQSEDIDLILQSSPTQRFLDATMAGVGFVRRGNYYEHPDSRFFVEFPRGPLAIGSDTSIQPAELPVAGVRLLLLSATDSCRDRLAAFYHWNDRQALRAAVAIATRHAVDLEQVRAWSGREEASREFEKFKADLEAAMAVRRRARPA